MARMYPAQLPKHVLDNPKLSSEVRVYEHIRDKVAGRLHMLLLAFLA